MTNNAIIVWFRLSFVKALVLCIQKRRMVKAEVGEQFCFAVPILPETDDDGGLNEVVEVFLEGGGIFICVESLSLWMAGDNDDTDGRCGDEVRMIE